MIERVTIQNFQSLVDIDLKLEPFTVIVGPTGSGKSAFVRALKAVASNIRGTGSTTRGAKTTTITVYINGYQVTLERTGSSGLYRITDPDGTERKPYTKLNGGVPEAVTEVLGISPVTAAGGSLTFAGQFDPPYLLTETGSSVARILGELTNVSMILAAGQEATRRSKGFTSTLRTREADLLGVHERIQEYVDLPRRLKGAQQVEERLQHTSQLADTIDRLAAVTDALETAETVLARHSALPEVPTGDAMLAAQRRLHDYTALVRAWADGNTQAAQAAQDVERWRKAEDDLHQELHAVLVAAGTCPTCDRPL